MIKLLYVPCEQEQADIIGKLLVENKLAACVNIFPIKSIYPWKDKIQNDNEMVLLVKTTKEKAEKATNLIKEKHNYEIPCILQFDCDVNEEYFKWMKGELNEN